MSKEAKIKAFKLAFRRPKSATKEAKDFKSSMEKMVESITTGNATNHDAEELCKAFKKEDRDYYIELLTYKLVKHWDEAPKLRVWEASVPELDDLYEAVNRVLGSTPSAAFVIDCWQRFYNDTQIARRCFELAPTDLTQYAADHISTLGSLLTYPPLASAVCLELFRRGTFDVEEHLSLLRHLEPAAACEMARADPRKFAELLQFKDLQPTTKLQLLKSKELRELLAGDATSFQQIAKDVPMLGFLHQVTQNVAGAQDDDDDELDEHPVVREVFDLLLADDSPIPITYYTGIFTSPTFVLAAPERAQQIIADHPGPTFPTTAAAQCDELVTMLKDLIDASFPSDANIKCKHIVIPGMVLTVPLSKVPGGLLKNTFPGNVYNDDGQLTGQVLFTGNSNSPNNSHTYLRVAKVDYDAVLGTKGKAVQAAVQDEFEFWSEKKYVAKSNGEEAIVAQSKETSYWVIKEPGLLAAPNRNGFGSAYRLTQDITRHVTEVN